MTLPQEPLLNTKLKTTPTEFASLLRGTGDVFRWEPDQFWVVTDYELASAILKGSEFSADRSGFFMSRMSGCPFHKISNFFSVVKKMMVSSEPPEHTARRKLAHFGIADNVIDDFKPAVEKTVEKLIAQIGEKKTFEFVKEIALPLPCTVLADLFCIPPERRADFYKWSNDMTQFFGGASDNIQKDADHANDGARSLQQYFTELIESRRKKPMGDFLSHLLRNQSAIGLDDSEVISQAVMMLVAGTVTTTDQICNNMFTLLDHSAVLDQMRDNPRVIEAALEEATRLDPAVNFVFRVAKNDTQLGSVKIKAGELAFISNHAVNRDPRIFEEPDVFKINRPRNPHLSYGSGIHYCLGAKLGRIQMRILFGQLLQRFPALVLTPGQKPVRKQQSLAFSGFESLDLSV